MSSPAADTSRRDHWQTVGHYVTALVLALEGVSHLEHRPTPWFFIALCWISAAVVTLVTVFHHRLQQLFPALQAVIYLAEGTVATALVFLTHHEGKVGLPFAWTIAACFLFGNAARELWRGPRKGV